MGKNTYLTKTIGLGDFGCRALLYLQSQHMRRLNLSALAQPQIISPYSSPPTDNPLTEVVFFITDMVEDINCRLVELYQSDFYVSELFKVIVVSLPDPEDKVPESFWIPKVNSYKEAADAVVFLTKNCGENCINSTAEEAIYQIMKSFNAVITEESELNVDFEDIKTIMNQKYSVMGAGEARGEGRALQAIIQATAAPCMQEFKQSPVVLLSVKTGPITELEMEELTEICDYLHEKFGDDTEVLFGHGTSSELHDKIRVVVMASVPAETMVLA